MAYWALKTWESDGKSYSEDKDQWKYFLKEKAIAIGWKELIIPLTKDTEKKEIREALRRKWPKSRAASTIYNFIHIQKDDYILICRGFNQYSRDVHLYGTAKEMKPFRDHHDSNWWRFKHGASIEEFPENRREIKKELLIKILSKGLLHGKPPHAGSLMLTLQQISKEGFESIIEWARH